MQRRPVKGLSEHVHTGVCAEAEALTHPRGDRDDILDRPAYLDTNDVRRVQGAEGGAREEGHQIIGEIFIRRGDRYGGCDALDDLFRE